MHRLLSRNSNILRSLSAVYKLNPSRTIRLQGFSSATSESLKESYIDIESTKDQLDHIKDSFQPIRKLDEVLNFNDLRQEVHEELLNPEAHRGIQSNDLPTLNKILKGHRRGELTILTGPTGVGKTTVISQLSLDYCKSGVSTLWGSFEILNKRLAKKMLSQFAEKDLAEHPEDFDEVADEFEKLPLHFLKFHSSTPISDVLKVCKQAVDIHDVKHIIIDNLQFMLSQQARSGLDKWELQENAIASLRSFATLQDVHITLVVHPRKETGEALDINSIFGSAKVTQEADNVIIIQRNYNHRTIDIKKNRYDGTLGSIKYKFNTQTLKIEEMVTNTSDSSQNSERLPRRFGNFTTSSTIFRNKE